ncbi:uromodulin-like [Tachyglossus aculeatus]|uniref:uromodulin-like n=1 Tax=Tachyglossus aculeatus TaxID=9261 RepID=UPI0018F77FBE|nr:uromodulin-like [Tachyglossus aculeatus]
MPALMVGSLILESRAVAMHRRLYFTLLIIAFPPCLSIPTATAVTESGLGPVSCSDCHDNATCEEREGSPMCSCRAGFTGNGLTCSDVDECTSSRADRCLPDSCVNQPGTFHCRCPAGFQFTPESGCSDVDECADPSKNRCHSLASCTNADGGYLCMCPAGYFGDGTQCDLAPWSRVWEKLDCGEPGAAETDLCFDPCQNYTVLDEPWRSSSFQGDGSNCDSKKSGWYRFMGKGGVRISETCVPINRCNTAAPMWLRGRHPSSEEGIMNLTACAHWSENCCLWKTDVLVKACPGDYYVYKLGEPPVCSLGYCTDPTTTEQPCNHCLEDEECKLLNGTWGCTCQEAFNSSDISSLQPRVTCGTNVIKVSLTRCQLEGLGFQKTITYLSDSSCVGFEEKGNRSLVSVETPVQNGTCGNVLKKNGTHAIYSNTLSVVNEVIIRDTKLYVNFQCAYPLDMKVSLETANKPMVSSLNISVADAGEFTVRMALFKNPNFTVPIEGSMAVLPVEATLYVGAILDEGDTSRFNLLMKNCYATPTNSSKDLLKHFIIQNSCPNLLDSTIQMEENGESPYGRFSIQMFQFAGNHDLVYLHCEIYLCDKLTEQCKPSCSRFGSRSGDIIDLDRVLDLGPIVRKDSQFLITSGVSRNLCK